MSLSPALLTAALAPAAATGLALLPLLFVDPNERPPVPLLVLPLLPGPPVAFLTNWRMPYAATHNKAVLAAVPQLIIPILLMRLAVWLEYHGTDLEGSGEEAMAYGLGFFISFFFGLIMVMLVSLAGYLGSRLAQREPAPERDAAASDAGA